MKIKLNECAQNALYTAAKRQYNGANVKIETILKHCAGEVIEAAEARSYWLLNDSNKDAYAEELADVVICVMIAAANDGVDLEKAINNKMRKNAARAAMQGDKL